MNGSDRSLVIASILAKQKRSVKEMKILRKKEKEENEKARNSKDHYELVKARTNSPPKATARSRRYKSNDSLPCCPPEQSIISQVRSIERTTIKGSSIRSRAYQMEERNIYIYI